MVKKSTQKPTLEKPLPVARLLSPDVVLKVDALELEFRKLNEIGELLWLPQDLSEAEKNARVLRALKCSIPDDHIDPRRSAFFMARSVFGDISEDAQC
jgi:hypothetical protein